MSADWSWHHSAREYEELYQEVEPQNRRDHHLGWPHRRVGVSSFRRAVENRRDEAGAQP